MSRRISLKKIARFRQKTLRHYRVHGRDFPWRRTHDPYEILVSEVMLQQTQVSRVLEKYEPFLKKFSNFRALAASSLRDVLTAWQGLGYNRRGMNLHKLAKIVEKKYDGKLPGDFEALKKLPGVGQSTAGAVMAFAFNKPSVFIETNIRRTFILFFFPRKKKVHDKEILAILKKVNNFPRSRKVVNFLASRGMSWREWYWALFDYGAMLGENDRAQNPNRRSAHYKKQQKFKGSRRELRGKILRLLLIAPQKKVKLVRALQRTPEEIASIIRELKSEKIIKENRGIFSIP